MGEIRIVRPGETRGYPYPVCKKTHISHPLISARVRIMGKTMLAYIEEVDTTVP